MSLGISGWLNICMYANAYSVCLVDSSGEMSALKQLEVEVFISLNSYLKNNIKKKIYEQDAINRGWERMIIWQH